MLDASGRFFLCVFSCPKISATIQDLRRSAASGTEAKRRREGGTGETCQAILFCLSGRGSGMSVLTDPNLELESNITIGKCSRNPSVCFFIRGRAKCIPATSSDCNPWSMKKKRVSSGRLGVSDAPTLMHGRSSGLNCQQLVRTQDNLGTSQMHGCLGFLF